MQKRFLMVIETGAVDTEESWLSEYPPEVVASLTAVVLSDGSQVPDDFKPCESDRYHWIEA
jgi:hypothetical protein